MTFNAASGLLDGYDVKKDLIADADITAPVEAVGKTRFTISPKARAAEGDLVVKVGDKTIEPVNGVYTFETEGDTEVAVSSPTSGIENVLVGEQATADVYNLQGTSRRYLYCRRPESACQISASDIHIKKQRIDRSAVFYIPTDLAYTARCGRCLSPPCRTLVGERFQRWWL